MDVEYKSIFSEKLGFGSGYDLGVSNIHVFYMVFGLSFELLFKSILVVKNPKRSVPEKHNLLFLADLASIVLSEKEKSILDLLSEYIVWVGKYPIPKREADLNGYYDKYSRAAVDRTEINNYTIDIYNGSLEWNEMNKLWIRINKIFFKEYERIA